jgi:hypothetical protein
MMEHDITKALEIWTLQNLLNLSIMFGILACGLTMIQNYYQALEKHLSLRVSIELWKVFTVLVVDILLSLTVLIGYMLLNPDIMADVKMAVPFFPIATVLYAVALVLRLFHHGHAAGAKNHLRALYFMLAASAVNVVGFTFIMEAASDEYLAHHPSEGWNYLKTHFRSGADPFGLELSQVTFYVCFPLLIAVLVWGICASFRRLRELKAE